MICAGVDAGSRTTKVVLLDSGSLDVVAGGVVDQGIDQDELAGNLFTRLLHANGIGRDQVGAIVGTGYGRKLISFADKTITEITCQAWGVRHRMPDVRTVIDIGGQDSKLLRLNKDGTVGDFVMNDRCAAGTGRFLEMLSAQLGVKLDRLGQLAGQSRNPAIISSMCVVFAETEIIGLLASGTTSADIVAGVLTSIATRVAAMSGRDLAQPIALTGGVAMVPGMDAALCAILGKKIIVAPQPQLTCALGAAILAWRQSNGFSTPAA
ncbi:MAG: acyl-CoA dehydratase activase [Thermoguttaceae bacterium]|jgi:predicted CoA-substrate-specific enzyme activase